MSQRRRKSGSATQLKAWSYRPDIFARSLRSRRSNTIGVLVFDISDPFCVLILRGIEKTLHSTSYLPILMDAHHERQQFEGYLDLFDGTPC